MSKLSKHVGIQIKNLRKNRKLTQEQLGELVQLPQSYIGGIERGEKNISMETLERIIDALQVKPGDLFAGYSSASYENSKLMDSIHVLLKPRSDDELRLIKKLVLAVISKEQ